MGEDKIKEIENILKKSSKSSGISLLLITNHAREVSITPYLLAYCSDLATGSCSRFQVVMLGRRLTIFSTAYFKFEKRFSFRICNEYAQFIFCVGLPGIMENSVNCHGKVMEFYYQISVGTLHLRSIQLYS